MRQWLKKNWGDPVWSKVIAWSIYTVIGLIVTSLYLWWQSKFSPDIDTAWVAARSRLWVIGQWLARPSTLPQGIVWLTYAVFAALAFWLIDQRGREVRALNSHWESKVKDEVKMVLVAQLVEDARKALQLSDHQRHLLNTLYVQYDRGGIEVRAFAQMRGLLAAAAQTQCDKLLEMRLVRVVSNPYDGFPPTMHLTKEGREYCEKNGLDKALS